MAKSVRRKLPVVENLAKPLSVELPQARDAKLIP